MPVLAVGGVLFECDEDGAPRVLLIRRAKPPRAGAWSIPGGHVERGERLEAAVRRELAEETGLVVEVGALVEVVELVSDDHHFVVLDYLCARISGELRAGDDASAAAFHRVDTLASLGVTQAVLDVVSRALAMTSIR